MVRLGTLVLALVAAFSSGALTTAASGFAASDGSVSFALNIPDENDTSLYFVLAGPSTSSWISVGMGNYKMKDTLMFIMYADSTGKNVTVSPRLSSGNVEPVYTSNVTCTVGPDSGIANGTMTARVLCQNCRTWKGGLIDPTSTAEKFIFGSGPRRSLKSNFATAALQEHSSYGTFTMDLTKAVGEGQFPNVVSADTVGTVQDSIQSDHNFLPALHAALMIIAFLGLMPIGLLILRVVDNVRWHGLNQTLSAVVALIGAFVGIYLGTIYNRSRDFQSAHQIFGIVIIVIMVAQFIIGFTHHRIYKKTSATTKLAPIHVWLGRVVIVMGMANGFLGFPLALNSGYNWALLGITVLVFIIVGVLLFWKWKQSKRQRSWRTLGRSEANVDLVYMNDSSPYRST